jgi:hypothetical protein
MYDIVANLREVNSLVTTSIDNSGCYEFNNIENIIFFGEFKDDNNNVIFKANQSVHTFDCRLIDGYYNNFCFNGILSEPIIILHDYGNENIDIETKLFEFQNMNVAISESNDIYLCTFRAGLKNIMLCKIANHEDLYRKYVNNEFDQKRPFNILEEYGKKILKLALKDEELRFEIH